jgi:hypothetical protein
MGRGFPESDANLSRGGGLFRNNKTFLHFGTTKHSCPLEQQNRRSSEPKDSWTIKSGARTKNSRFHREAPCRRPSVFCHDVAGAKRGSSRIVQMKTLTGILAGIPDPGGTTISGDINNRRLSNAKRPYLFGIQPDISRPGDGAPPPLKVPGPTNSLIRSCCRRLR